MRRIICYISVAAWLCSFTSAIAQKKWQHLRPARNLPAGGSFMAGAEQEQWELQTTLPGAPPLFSVSAVSRDICWVCGPTGAVYRTLNGGTTWQAAAAVTTTEAIFCVTALSATTAFIGGGGANGGGGDAKIYRTTNGGLTWQAVYTGTGLASFWDAIHFFDAQNGIALSDPPVPNGPYLIVKTSDGGATWTPIANPPLAQVDEFGLVNCFYFYDNLHGWFGTIPASQSAKAGRVFRTTDGGNTWTGVEAGNNVNVEDVRFISPSVGIRTSGAPPLLARSTDGGQTWTPVPLNNFPVSGIQFLSPATSVSTPSGHQFWLYGEAGASFTPFILTSVDSGSTWQQQTIAGLGGNSVIHMSAVSFGAANDSVQAWAATIDPQTGTSGGQILSYHAPLSTKTAVREQPSIVPVAFALSQNYPNPFNPSTVISYELPKASLTTLKVYDVLGHEIVTLVRGRQPAGKHDITFDASGLADGVYFYRLEAGDFTETKKMILAK